MRDSEQLPGGLPKLVDLHLKSSSLHGVVEAVKINRSLIGEGVEKVVCLNGLHPSLLVPKDEVDPLVKVGTDVRALKGGAVLGDEVVRVGTPRGKRHIPDDLSILAGPKGEAVAVQEERGVREEELRDQLLWPWLRGGPVRQPRWQGEEEEVRPVRGKGWMGRRGL